MRVPTKRLSKRLGVGGQSDTNCIARLAVKRALLRKRDFTTKVKLRSTGFDLGGGSSVCCLQIHNDNRNIKFSRFNKGRVTGGKDDTRRVLGGCFPRVRLGTRSWEGSNVQDGI